MRRFKQIGIDVDVNRAIENSRHTFDESENDILRRMLFIPHEASPPPKLRDDNRTSATRIEALTPPLPGTRTTGRWTVELLGHRYAEPSLKAAYRKALLLLSAKYPDFLVAFAAEGGRRRKFVARSPAELYLSSPGLAKKHAASLAGDWFFDTNLSTDQVSRRVRIAARLCGLRYGPELQLLNNLEQI